MKTLHLRGFFVIMLGLTINRDAPNLSNTLMPKSTEKPIAPADDDCCGGGACNPCVWDSYYEALQLWRIAESKRRDKVATESE
jgi:hypothetical protein